MSRHSSRGQVSPKAAVALVLAVAITAIIAAFLLPVAVNQLEGNETTTITQDVGTTENVTVKLNTTLNSVDGTADSANYTLETDTQSITHEIDNGTTQTYAFDRGDVNVTVNDVNSGTPGNAEATYEWPTEFNFSDGGRSLYGILGLAIVLAVFIMVLGIALDASNRL